MRRLFLTLMIAGAGPAFAAPADLCVELNAYVEKAASPPPAGAPPQSSAAAAAPEPGRAAQAAPREPQGGQKEATAVEAAKDRAQPGAGGQDASQQTSGMSGPITESGVGAAGPQGRAQAQSSSGDGNPRSLGRGPEQKPNSGAPDKPPATPAPAAAAAAKKPIDAAIMERARSAASGQDQAACREATQTLRRAGAALPAPLLALGALKPELLVSSPPSPTTPTTPPSPTTPAAPETPAPR